MRYLKTRRSLDGHDDPASHWIATIQLLLHPFKRSSVAAENLLGFRVIEFRVEPEVAEVATSKMDARLTR